MSTTKDLSTQTYMLESEFDPELEENEGDKILVGKSKPLFGSSVAKSVSIEKTDQFKKILLQFYNIYAEPGETKYVFFCTPRDTKYTRKCV